METFNRRTAKCMKIGKYVELDEALYIWFVQVRENGCPVSGPLLAEKASHLYALLYPDSSVIFTASTGYLARFKHRFHIRNLNISGEKLSSDTNAAAEFVANFPKLIDGYTCEQVFNSDETGLYFRNMPNNTLASWFEKRAEGFKKIRERVTVNVCSNMDGSLKLPLLVIGKSARPRCFKNINLNSLPVLYKNQANAWMNSDIFYNWFHNEFVPYVQYELLNKGIEAKALLFIDNCSAHPPEHELVSEDGLIRAKFFPPNVTALIQPMDQGVIECLKRRYRKSLLRDMLMFEQEFFDTILYLKSVNILMAIERISKAWDYVSCDSIKKSWKNLFPIVTITEPFRESSSNYLNNSLNNAEFIEDFHKLGYDMEESDINSWMEEKNNDTCNQLIEIEIVSIVRDQIIMEESSEDKIMKDFSIIETSIEKVSDAQALDMFEMCISWLRFQPESTESNITLLTSLKELAASKLKCSIDMDFN